MDAETYFADHMSFAGVHLCNGYYGKSTEFCEYCGDVRRGTARDTCDRCDEQLYRQWNERNN
ncbi:hypothetical protein AAVH_08874 [Aphelenchoides avenae]|nr:hypothetical protein AAVH_08874 [Aphelenchus avenae]